jgi:CRISPR-associated endonuclease/helicase Cas3
VRIALAHSGEAGEGHGLEEHLRAVAALAHEFASPFGGGEQAALAGLWHDLGKYARDFQDYLRDASQGPHSEAHVRSEDESRSGKKCDHSSAGAVLVASRKSQGGLPIGLAIAGHHTGLKNQGDVANRLISKRHRLEAALAEQPPASILEQVVPPLPLLATPKSKHDKAGMRALELYTRFLFSALCDADFLDTEAFFSRERAGLRGNSVDITSLAAKLSASVDSLAFGAPATIVNHARTEVRAACKAAATQSRGVFTLTVPTGGGKTLAAMEFALQHAAHHGLRRVVVALPFTAILEQSADVYRGALGVNQGDPTVLEHHASLDPERETARSRIATENWDAPIIVTTNVQLLESLFARRTSACRKLHNLAGSVVVLDEAQTLPRELLACTTEVLECLVRDYGCTLVLCTATQPALRKEHLRGVDAGFAETREIIPDPVALAATLTRVNVDWSLAASPTSYVSLAPEIAALPDVLAIVHRRDDARVLAEAIDTRLGDTSTLHLSALMCPAHRREKLAEIKRRKADGDAVRLVATQLVEAGVDLDFAVVYRALAGLDSLAQAAGRCNREGKLTTPGRLKVFQAETNPPPGILVQALEVTRILLKEGPLDIFDPDTQRRFFQRLYQTGNLDKRSIQELRAELAFEDVDKNYVIVDDSWSAPVVIPYDDRSRKALAVLERDGASRWALRELRRTTISVNRRDVAAWQQAGFVRELRDGIANVLLNLEAYDDRFGLVPERVGLPSPSEFVV